MEATRSNGSGVRARSRKVNTSPASAPKEANGHAKGLKNGRPSTRQRTSATQQRVMPAKAGPLPPFDTYAAITIEDVQPQLDGGRCPIKRVVGDTVEVSADILKEGHDALVARVFFQPVGQPQATEQEAPMHPTENDRWVGQFSVDQNTRYVYGVLAFTDVFGSWRADFQKRLAAAQDVTSELREGLRLVEAAVARGTDPEDRGRLKAYVDRWKSLTGPTGQREAAELAI